jgi:hypothetical protein
MWEDAGYNPVRTSGDMCQIKGFLEEERTLSVSENRVLRRIFGPKGRKWQEAGEHCIMRSFITCTLRQILLG